LEMLEPMEAVASRISVIFMKAQPTYFTSTVHQHPSPTERITGAAGIGTGFQQTGL